MAVEEILKIAFEERFSRFERLSKSGAAPLLIKEPNVNDQGFISYVDDQEYLVVIYVPTYDSLGSNTYDYP